MAFRHNSEVAPNPQRWGEVDKTRLPRIAHADMGEADKKTTWRFPHHEIVDGGDLDDMGVYTTGTMYVNRGGVAAAWQRMQQAGIESSAADKAHIQAHRKALGMGEFARAEERIQVALPLEVVRMEDEYGTIEIQVLMEGEWRHPQGQEYRGDERWLVITSQLADEFHRNFKAGVMGKDVPLHERHAEGAVSMIQGHLKDTRRSKDSKGREAIYGTIKITDPMTQQKVREGSLKYFSPTLAFGRENPETGKRQNVIVDGAITEMPFLKGMDEARIINLEDVPANDPAEGDSTRDTKKEDETMDGKDALKMIADFAGTKLEGKEIDIGKLSDELVKITELSDASDADKQAKVRELFSTLGLHQAPAGDGGAIVTALTTFLSTVLDGEYTEEKVSAALEAAKSKLGEEPAPTNAPEPTQPRLEENPTMVRLMQEHRELRREKIHAEVEELARLGKIAQDDVVELEKLLVGDEGVVHLEDGHKRMIEADVAMRIIKNAPGVTTRLEGNVMASDHGQPGEIENLDHRVEAAAKAVSG